MDTGQGPHHIECGQGRGERLGKMYESIQNRIDSDEEYRQNIIKAREVSRKRVKETGWMSSTDEFLNNTYIMTWPKKQRDALFENTNEMSIAQFLTSLIK